MKARVRGVVTGLVQGVGFRLFVQRQALRLGLTGWVRNRGDGSVELLAEGERNQIDALLAQCRQGPSLSEVDDVEVAWEAYAGEHSTFVIAF
jgi:acylphosphatase